MLNGSHNFISGRWVAGSGELFSTHNPANGATAWQAFAVSTAEIEDAVAAAAAAFEHWAETSLESRIEVLQRFAQQLSRNKQELAEMISRETGKPDWEALAEVDAMAGKVPISIEGMQERRRPSERPLAGAVAATRYKPIGVMAVFGPFNMPGHLPNGHIVPALLAGNTIVFKPSEMTAGVGFHIAKYLEAAGIPPGVFNLVQGGRDVGAALVRHPGIHGILFTGSVAGGLAIARAVIDQPGKILALEMGGNNPLIVWDAKDHAAAAHLAIQSAYITAGQRCSCARRLIVADSSDGTAFLERLMQAMQTIRVGPSTLRPEPFMGPVISDAAAAHLLTAQAGLIAGGGVPLVKMHSVGDRRPMLSPGLIDVTLVRNRADEELFGPLLQVIRVPDFAAAIAEANCTAYGLAAGLFSDSAEHWQIFQRKIRAGVIYWNRQTTGGSSSLPFGGVGLSGNYRPSGYWAADYCSFPVASIEVPTLAPPGQKTPGIG